MEARRGVAIPPPKRGSQEAGESIVQCCGLLFVRSHLFFELHFRRSAKLQQEWSDSNEPVSSPRQLCELRDAPGRKRGRRLLQSSRAHIEKPCAQLLHNPSSAGTGGWRQLWPFLPWDDLSFLQTSGAQISRMSPSTPHLLQCPHTCQECSGLSPAIQMLPVALALH